jgi:hypothetical protein
MNQAVAQTEPDENDLHTDARGLRMKRGRPTQGPNSRCWQPRPATEARRAAFVQQAGIFMSPPLRERAVMPLSALVRASWLVAAFEPLQEPTGPVNVRCDRGFLQPGCTQLIFEAAELRAKFYRRVTLVGSRSYR